MPEINPEELKQQRKDIIRHAQFGISQTERSRYSINTPKIKIPYSPNTNLPQDENTPRQK